MIIDYNKHQSSGAVEDILRVQPIDDKWRAFGWNAAMADGHNCVNLINRLEGMKHGIAPQVCIAITQKGKGVSFTETDAKWHTTVMNEEEALAAKEELGIISHEERIFYSSAKPW